jgi:hypothetical protein
MLANVIKFKHDSDNDSGGSRLDALYMLISRLAQTNQFLSQQLAKLSGR